MDTLKMRHWVLQLHDPNSFDERTLFLGYNELDSLITLNEAVALSSDSGAILYSTFVVFQDDTIAGVRAIHSNAERQRMLAERQRVAKEGKSPKPRNPFVPLTAEQKKQVKELAVWLKTHRCSAPKEAPPSK